MAAAVANYAVAAVSGGANIDTSADAFTSQATGSTFVILLTYGNGTEPATVEDNYGNTYVQEVRNATLTAVARAYVCQNGIGGPGHYADVDIGFSDYPGLHFMELTGVEAASYDSGVEASSTDSSQPFTASSNANAQADEVIISYISADGTSNPANTFAETTGFTLLGQVQDSTQYWLSAAAYKVVSTIAIVPTSWTMDNAGGGGNSTVVLMGFKASAGGGGTETAAVPAAGAATVGATARSTARADVTPAAGAATVSAAASATARTVATPAAGTSIVSATTPQSESAAEIWAYVLSNGKTAGQNLVEINAVMTGPIEGDIDLAGAIRVLLAVAAGKTSIVPGVPGAATVEFRAADDSETRVVAEMVGSERVGVTITP